MFPFLWRDAGEFLSSAFAASPESATRRLQRHDEEDQRGELRRKSFVEATPIFGPGVRDDRAEASRVIMAPITVVRWHRGRTFLFCASRWAAIVSAVSPEPDADGESF